MVEYVIDPGGGGAVQPSLLLRQRVQDGNLHPRKYKIVVAAYIYYCTVRYSIMAPIKLCKIPQSEANKSANRWGNLRTKSGVVPPSVLHLPSSIAHQIYFFTRLSCLLPCLNKIKNTNKKLTHLLSLL
jgi:hypothetical protein